MTRKPTVVISVSDGVLEAASWREMYLLLRYEVVGYKPGT